MDGTAILRQLTSIRGKNFEADICVAFCYGYSIETTNQAKVETMRQIFLFLVIALLSFSQGDISAFAQTKQDRYIGYYYPAPQRVEVYCARVDPFPNVDKKRRVGFIIGIKTGMSKQPYSTPYSVFAKGGQSDKLLIIAKQDGYLDTIYRARALLAELSTSARTTPIFVKSNAPEELTFLDLITMLGFQKVTLSDGDGFSHQIILLPGNNKQCHQVKKNKQAQ